MKKLFTGRITKGLYPIGRILLAMVFIYAGIAKINSPQDFADKIAGYQILPAALINLLAMGLPLFELACGLFVLSGFYVRIGALGMLGLLSIFMGALVIALVRGLSVDCGCFGPDGGLETPWMALWRDTILLVLAGVSYNLGWLYESGH